MKKNKFVRLTAFLLLVIMLLPTFVSCNKNKNNGTYYGDKYDAEYEEKPIEYYIKFTDNTEKTIYVPDGVSLDDPEIYAQAKDQWRELILGASDEDFKHSDEYAANVKAVNGACKAAYDRFENTGRKSFGYTVNSSSDALSGGADIQAVYDLIYNMAKGYGTVGSDYYKDEDIAGCIETALEYAYNNYYGPNLLDPDKTPNLFKWNMNEASGNWWYRDVGIPLSLMPTLLIMEEYLGSSAVERYLAPFDKLNPYPHMTMANRLWIGSAVIASALLQNDAERILKSKNDLLEIFLYVDEEYDVETLDFRDPCIRDGFYSDGSFIQHRATPYAGGYGLSLMDSLADIMMALRGTRFAFYEDVAEMQFEWIFNAYLPLNYEGKMFASVRGRNITRSGGEDASNVSVVITMVKMATYAPKEIREKLKSAIRYNLVSCSNNYTAKTPLGLVDYMVKIKNDETVSPVGFQGAKVYGYMDRIVQQNSKYGVCVSLNSTRIYKYEASAGDNVRGWYISDGAIYIYTDGYEFDSEFFNNADSYKIPGTTVVSDTRKPIATETNIFNSSPFVGGVTDSNGKYAVTVFELGYEPNQYFNPDIKANKTYFLFDNEIVAVGSGISGTSSKSIYTTIDNREWRNGDKFTINGEDASMNKLSADANYMHFTNMGGYVFFDETEVDYAQNASYLELWINHGKTASKEKYAYVYLPEATADETAAYYSNPDVEILTQTDNIHVVRENKLGITGYAFYYKGEANGVKVSNKCVVMVEENNGEYTVTVSDPTRLLKNLEVTLELPVSQVVSADKEASVEFEGGKAIISLDIASNGGQTYTVKLK